MDFNELMKEVRKELTTYVPETEVSEIMLTTLYILEREGVLQTKLDKNS